MATLTLEFSGFKNRPYVEFDEREICVNSLKKCTIDISSGEHKIFVCEKNMFSVGIGGFLYSIYIICFYY